MAITGNWYNTISNKWVFGFFESFAIYDNKIWKYENLTFSNYKGSAVLRNGKLLLKLNISKIGDSVLKIAEANSTPINYRLVGNKLPSHNTKDVTTFKDTHFQISENATITGYVHGKSSVKQFSIGYMDLIKGDYKMLYADIDSAGRFSITIPLLNTSEVMLECDTLRRIDVIEPGEDLFFFYDLRHQQPLVMGTNDRLHNELSNYQPYEEGFLEDENLELKYKKLQGLEYLNAKRSQLARANLKFENYLRFNPFASTKFKHFIQNYNKSRIGMELMQKQFNFTNRQIEQLPEEYLLYVRDSLFKSSYKPSSISGEFFFLRKNYLDYTEQKDSSITIQNSFLLSHLIENNIISVPENNREIVRRVWERDSLLIIDPVKAAQLTKSITISELNIVNNLEAKYSQQVNESAGLLAGITLLDHKLRSLKQEIVDEDTRRLLVGQAIYAYFESNKTPLPSSLLKKFSASLRSSAITSILSEYQSYLIKMPEGDFNYQQSLINTNHLRGAKNADSLLHDLVAPYLGKVIYIDFWGSWCEPCLRELAFVKNIKQNPEFEEVIFIYFASRSPENDWKTVIQEFKLSGRNMVHYRLPDSQQKLLETRLSVAAFPSYVLIDKKGNVSTLEAPRPSNKEQLIKAIKGLQNRN